MQFIISRDALLNLLAKTQNIVEKKNTMPILVNILMDVDHDKLSVFATDLEVSITDHVSVEMKSPGKIAVDTKNLFNIIKEFSPGNIQILKKPNNWIEIRQNKVVFNIMGLAPEEYPLFPTFETTEFISSPTEMLYDMINKTIYAVSNDETRYHLNGVYFEQMKSEGNASYRMVATDGHRLSLIERQTESNPITAFSQGCIIPRKGLIEIRKILESAKGQKVDFAIEGAQIILKQNTATLMVRLIEGRYPNYQQLIPQNLNKELSVKKDEFMSSLRRISLVANAKSKGITLGMSKGLLKITSNNPDVGDAEEEIAIEYAGEDLKIGFNARYLLDILGSIDDENILINFKDQLSPGILRPKNDKNYTCIIMPMRI
jgi:DNA polymerase-3 subunit beta